MSIACISDKSLSQKLLACGGCKLVHYCSKECQKVHWKIHKLICNDLKAYNEIWIETHEGLMGGKFLLQSFAERSLQLIVARKFEMLSKANPVPLALRLMKQVNK
jgi:hypothetical protein